MMKNVIPSIIIGLIFVLTLSAQQEGRPTPPPRETPLPEQERIDREEPQRLPEFELPEYVITGRATFRLPYVQKPKITERYVYTAEVPETMRRVDRDVTTTPIDPPTKTFGEFQQRPPHRHGQMRIGYGRFNTPVVSGWGSYRQDLWDISGRVSYLNTEGYKPFAQGYDFDGHVQFGYRIGQSAPPIVRGSRSSLAIGFEGMKHRPHNLLTLNLEDGVVTTRRFHSNFSEARFTTGTYVPFDLDIVVGWRGSTVEDGDGETTIFNDDEFYVQAHTLGYVQSIRVKSDIEYIANRIEFDSAEELWFDLHHPQFFKGTARALIPIRENRVLFEVGGSLFSTRNVAGATGSAFKPFVELRVIPFHTLTLYGRFAPEVIHRSLYSLNTLNPYIHYDGLHGVSEETMNATAGVLYTPDRTLNLHAYSQYREIETYPNLASVREDGRMNLTFAGTTKIFSLHADLRYALSRRDILTTQAVLRYTTNDLYETSIPSVAPVEIAAVYTHEFPFGLRASGGVEFLSPRRAVFENGEDLGMILNLHLDVHYQFHNIMGIYMKIDNLLNHTYERYYTYPGRPLYVEGGIQLSF